MVKNQRPKEKGLVPINESELFSENPNSEIKPLFVVRTMKVVPTWNEHVFPFPVHSQERYADSFLEYLNRIYQKTRAIDSTVSFCINPQAWREYCEISEKQDLTQKADNVGVGNILNEGRLFREAAVADLNHLLSAGVDTKKQGMVVITPTRENAVIQGSPGIITPVIYQAQCNSYVPIGMRTSMRVLDRETHIFWELHLPTFKFLDYLKRVHKLITGNEHVAGNPLKISLSDINATPEQIEKNEQILEAEANPNSDERVRSRFGHATFYREGKNFFLTHIDGSIFSYDFNKLRRRLFSFSDVAAHADEGSGEYSKIFKIDFSKGKGAPFYNSLINPKEFDMHDLADAFFARRVL